MFANQFFPPETITQFTEPFTELLVDNLPIILGILAFTVGLTTIFHLFTGAAFSMTDDYEGGRDDDYLDSDEGQREWRNFQRRENYAHRYDDHGSRAISSYDRASKRTDKIMKGL